MNVESFWKPTIVGALITNRSGLDNRQLALNIVRWRVL